MADYASTALLKARLGISDATDDTILAAVLTGVSRMIDQYCGRWFYVPDNDETYYFTAEFTDVLYPGDIVSVTTLQTDQDGDRTYETTWGSDDYDLEPFNAATYGKPYTEIRVSPNGSYSFPTVAKGVKLVGKRGWPSVPGPISEAYLLQSERLFKRKDAIFGVMGAAEMGQGIAIAKFDPDVKLLLDMYCKFDVLGV